MNKEIVILREAIAKIIPMIAGKGLKVTQMGTGAYVKADPRTGVPYLINIPSIPDNATPEFVASIQGFIDHEVAHVLFTDFNYKAREKTPKLHSLHNIFEDTRIERGMAEKFPGSKRNLATLRAWFCENITKPALKNAKSQEEAFGYILVVAMRALAGHREMKDFMDDENLWAHPLMAALMSKMSADFIKRIPLLASTADAYEAAVELHGILYPPPPPAPPQPEPQPEDQEPEKNEGEDDQEPSDGEDDEDHSDEEQTGDGEGEGEREHTEDNEDASGGEGESEEDEEKDQDAGDGEDEGSGEGENEADDESEADAGGDSSDDGDDEPPGEEDAEGDDAGSEDEADEDAGEDESEGAGEPNGEEGDADDADDENGSGSSSDDADDGDQNEDSDDAADGSQASEPDEDAEGEDGETEEDDQSNGAAGSDLDDQDDESDGDADSGDADGESEEGDETDETDADGANEDVAVEHDSDADNEVAEEPEDGEEPMAAVGYDGHNPFEALEDEDLADKDLSSSIAVLIQKEAIEAVLASDYSVFTRQYDRIEPLPVPETFDQAHVTRLEDQTRQMTGVMQKDIERMMAAQSRIFKVGGQRSGKLNGPGLHRIMSNDDRVFARREEMKGKDTAVSLLMDCSGSMEGAKQATAVSASYALATTLERVNIPCECLGFTTMGYVGRHNSQQWPLSHKQWEELLEAFNAEVAKGVTFHRMMPIFMPVFKAFQERLNVDIKRRFAYMQVKQPHQGGNIDGESLEYAAIRLAQRKEKRKVIIVLSDGHPAGAINDSGHLKMMAERLTKQGFDLVGIGIKDHAVSRFYDKHVVLQDIADLPGEVMKQLRVILQK